MKTKAVIILSQDDYFKLVFYLGLAIGQCSKNGERAEAAMIHVLYRKISESVTFAEDHEKSKS